MLRYAFGLRRFYNSYPLSEGTSLRSLAQGLAVGLAMLELLEELGVAAGAPPSPPLDLPAYSETLSFRAAFAAAGGGAAASASYRDDKSIVASVRYFSRMCGDACDAEAAAPPRLGARALQALRFSVASLSGKALWALMAAGGSLDVVRTEAEKMLRWLLSGRAAEGAAAAGAAAAAPAAAQLDPAPKAGVFDGPRARDDAWALALRCLSAAVLCAPEGAAHAEAALELHDATIEYAAAHAT